MHLLDDVRLVESDILAPSIVSTFWCGEHLSMGAPSLRDFSSTWPVSYELSDSGILEKLKFIGHGTMIGSHHWQISC